MGVSQPRGSAARSSLFGARNSQVIADLASKLFLDLSVARDSRRRARCRVSKDCVIAALPNKQAAVRLEVPDEVGAFH